MDRITLKQNAKNCLSENKKLYFVNIIYFAICIAISYIPFVNSFSFIVDIFLTFILTSIMLKASKGYGVDYNIGTDNLGRYLLSYLAQFAIMLIPMAMYIFGLVVSVFGGLLTINDGNTYNLPASVIMTSFSGISLTVGIIICLIGFIGLIFLGYMLFPVIYLSLDDEFGGDAGECISQGIKMMKGHKWELFVLQLSFIPWMLLSTITCGIALIYVMPYMQLTYCNYYLSLMKNNIDNVKINDNI